MEVLEDDCQIEVFDSEVHTFKAYNLDVVCIQHEERKLWESHKAVFGGSDANNGLGWAAVELKALLWDVNFDRSAVRIALLLNQTGKTQKFGVEAFTSLTLSLFLFKLIHVVELVSPAAKINILSGNSWFFVELNVQYFFRAKHDWGNQV